MRGQTGRIRGALGTTAGFVLLAIWSANVESRDSRGSASPHDPPFELINTNLSDYIWPTDAGNIGTSTFGEYRRTHFHGGIDISTGNTIGYKVFAVRDGYVSRIRVSPTGYGRMLYVRHPDGYSSTYAHLSRFSATIDARVSREQRKQESFPVDIECKPGEFPVKKGEIIAYTGDTGVGTPHLHFEIRDESMDPINPLLCTEFSVPDNIPPAIKRVAITPLGEFSTVDGSMSPRIFSVRALKKNEYRISGTIQLTGQIGFAITVNDMSNSSRFKHGVYSHKVFIDDTLIYTVQLDRVPGKNAHEIGLYYDWALRDAGRGKFEKLYMDSPSTLMFYSPRKPNAGVVNATDFAEGPHTFRIVSTDFNNNSSQVTGIAILNHPPAFTIQPSGNGLKLSFPEIDKVHKVLMFTKRNGSDTWSQKTMTPVPYAEGNVIHIADAKGRFDAVKFVAENAYGTRSLPQFHFLRKPNGPAGAVHLEHDLADDCIR
ncbi:MAG: M23 family metallopeptidase, partial [Bacteroidota bacterium]